MKVLIIEDEKAIEEVEAAYIKKAGYEVLMTDNGDDALEIFHTKPIDLIILDINIPGKNGLEVCKQIRVNSQVPIIVVTAKSEEIDQLAGFDLGIDDYVIKPFSPAILVARIKRLLPHTQGKIIQTRDFIIDPGSFSIIKEGVSIPLTVTQFNILTTLAKKPHTIISREYILDHAYPEANSNIFDRTIDAHIKSIRKIIEKNPIKPVHIITMIGKGYMFIP